MPHISDGRPTAQRAEGASVQALDLAVAALVVRGEGETLSTVSAQPRAAVEGHCVREGGRERGREGGRWRRCGSVCVRCAGLPAALSGLSMVRLFWVQSTSSATSNRA